MSNSLTYLTVLVTLFPIASARAANDLPVQGGHIIPVVQKISDPGSNGVFRSLPAKEFVFSKAGGAVESVASSDVLGFQREPGTEIRRLPHHRQEAVAVDQPQMTDSAHQSIGLPGSREKTLRFAFNSSRLTDSHRVTLLQQIDDFRSATEIVVTGHTDSSGTATYNLLLSHKRAAAVKDYLVQHGISADRIILLAAGQGNPVASNDSADGRAANRRVIIVH